MDMKKLIAIFLPWILAGAIVSLSAVPAQTLSSLEGVVVDAKTGAPVAGVTIQGLNDLRNQPVVATDEEGRFVLENIPLGRVQLLFDKNRYLEETIPFTVASGQTARVGVVKLTPGGIISGKLRKTDGTPAVNIGVELFSYKVLNGTPRLVLVGSSSTNDLGEYRLTRLLPNRFLVGFNPSGPRERNIRCDCGEFQWFPNTPNSFGNEERPFLYPGVGDVASAEWILIDGAEVRLKDTVVRANRFGVVRLHFRSPELPKDIKFDLIDAFVDNSIVFGNPSRESWAADRFTDVHLDASDVVRSFWPIRVGTIEAGTRWTTASGEDLHLSKRFEFTGRDTDVFIDLSKPEGQLDVQVFLERPDGSRIPLAGVVPKLCDVESDACLSPFHMKETGADGVLRVRSVWNGRYTLTRLDNMPPDSYVASALQEERNALSSAVIVTTDPSTLNIIVKTGLINTEGRVLDNEGHAVGNAVVGIVPDAPLDVNRLEALRRTARTDQDGRFLLSGVSPGNYRIYARLPWGSNSLEPAAELGRRGTPVRLQESGRLEKDLQLLTGP